MSDDDLKQLLQDTKDYLHISWDDEKTDKNLSGMIKRGMSHLNKIAGVTLNFIEEDSPRQLLLDYVRYANSQALEVFNTNFQGELLELNLEYAVKKEQEEGATNENKST